MTKPYGGQKPTFHEFITPIGLCAHSYHDRPSLKTDDRSKQPIIDPKTGIQEAEYKVTLAWDKSRIGELDGIIQLAIRVKGEGWPESMQPNAFFALEPFFRDGDKPEHNTKAREYLFGKYYLNFKQKAVATRDPANPQVIIYTGAPGLLGPRGPEDLIMPMDWYPGCTGRVSGIMFATEYAGKHFISTRLNNVQKYEDAKEGERIGGGGRPTAASQFGALKNDPVQGAPFAGLGSMFGNLGGPNKFIL